MLSQVARAVLKAGPTSRERLGELRERAANSRPPLKKRMVKGGERACRIMYAKEWEQTSPSGSSPRTNKGPHSKSKPIFASLGFRRKPFFNTIWPPHCQGGPAAGEDAARAALGGDDEREAFAALRAVVFRQAGVVEGNRFGLENCVDTSGRLKD